MSEKAEAQERDIDKQVASDNQASDASGASEASASNLPESASETKSKESEPVSESKPAATEGDESSGDGAPNAENQAIKELDQDAQALTSSSKEEADAAVAVDSPENPVEESAKDSSSKPVQEAVSARSDADGPEDSSVSESVQLAQTERSPASLPEPTSISESPIQEASTAPASDAVQLLESTETDSASSSHPRAKVEVDLPSFPEVKHHIPAEAVPTEAAFRSENFGRDEVRHLLVPVKPFNRLVGCLIVIFSASSLLYMFLTPGPRIRAQGMHTVALPEAGAYVLSFHGEITDPYGWTKDGRYRRALSIEVEPLDKGQIVEKITPIKDMSGGTYFTVGEYQFNLPGKYKVTVQWEPVEDRAKGQIFFEKDPVERFFLKWILGIAGTIAFFYSIGVPLSTRAAISTLDKPQKS